MHNMPVVVGNTVANVTGSGTANYAHPRSNNAKLTPMHIRSKFGQLGPSKGQFNSPHGFCLGTDEDIIVADTNNHRIQVLILIMYQLLHTVRYIISKRNKYFIINKTTKMRALGKSHVNVTFYDSRFLIRLVPSSFNSVFLAKKKDSCGILERWPL